MGTSSPHAAIFASTNSIGWTKDDNGLYAPKWTTLSLAAEACYELLCCGCKKVAERTADAKELIWNVQAYATVKDVIGNAFESRLAR